MTEDEQHLNLLSVFHYVVAGLVAFFSCFALPHVIIGSVMITAEDVEPVERLFGVLFGGMGLFFLLGGWVLAGFLLAAAGKLRRREGHLFCMVVAGVSCAFVPFGTLLGVFTLIVLMRDSVRRLFDSKNSSPEGSQPA